MSDYAYIVHEPADAPRAAALLQALRAAKLDARGDAPLTGEPDAATVAEIEGAWVVIPLWSEHSTDRAGPQAAYRAAEPPAQRGAYLGVLLDGVPPPFGFGGLQAIDLGKWSGGRDPKLQALVETVKQRLRSGPAGDMPDPVEVGTQRKRTLVIAGIAALLAVLAAGGWWLMRPSPSQRQAIDRELAAIPCSWLKVDPVDDGSNGTLALTGVADDPARAGEVIRGLVRGAAKPATVTIDRIAKIGSNDCPAIDVPRRIRQDEGGRLRVISDSVGRDSSSRLADARVQLHFRGADNTMALFGMEPNGEVTLIFPDYAALQQLKGNPDVGYTHDDSRSYEFTLPATHTGWTGLLLVTGSGALPPFAGHASGTELPGMNSHEFADWLGRATGAGVWQAEMTWYEIQAR